MGDGSIGPVLLRDDDHHLSLVDSQLTVLDHAVCQKPLTHDLVEGFIEEVVEVGAVAGLNDDNGEW